MNETITDIAKRWGGADPAIKRELIREIVRSGSKEGLRLLNQIVSRDRDVEIRQAARKAYETLERYCEQSEVSYQGMDEELLLSMEDQIFAWLQSDDRELEIKAMQEAQACNSARVLEYLRETWDYWQDERVRATLVKTLAVLGGVDEIPLIYRFLEDENPRVRANAIEALDLMNHPNVYPVFVQWLSDSDNRVKANCLKALRKIGGDSVNKILADMLRSEYTSYKESAIYVISLTPSRPGLSLLREFLYSEYDPDLLERALYVIQDFSVRGLREASDVLIEYGNGWEALVEVEQTQAQPKVSVNRKAEPAPSKSGFDPEMLKSSDRDVVRTGLQWVLDLKLIQQGPQLARLLTAWSEDSRLLSFIIRIVGELGLSDYVSMILPHLKSEDDRVRANAVEAIGLLRKGREFLEPALKDHNNRVRANAIVALKDLPKFAVMEAVYQMVADSDPLYRRSALYAIRHLKNEMALSALEQLLYDADDTVRAQALEVLKHYEICGVPGATHILKQHGDSLYETRD